MRSPNTLRVFGTAFGLCLTVALGVLPGQAQAQSAAGGAAAAGAPNLRVQKSCNDAPNLGLNMVTCRVDVDNQLGTANSAGPSSIVDRPASSNPGVTFAGVAQGSTFQCSTPAGGLPANINCSFPSGLTFGNQSGNGGPAFLNFVVPPGATLRNCASATQGPGARPDSNPANNTNICTSFTRPPGGGGRPVVTKSCTPGANQSLTCTITVTNNGTGAIPSGTQVVETLSGAPAGTGFTGAAGLACPPATIYAQPINCTTTSPIAGNGGTATFTFAFRAAAHSRFRNCAALRTAAGLVEGCTAITMP